MQGQKSNKNVNWNVKETYFNLNINYMTAFDRIKLLHNKKKILTLHSVEVSSSPNLPTLFVISHRKQTEV